MTPRNGAPSLTAPVPHTQEAILAVLTEEIIAACKLNVAQELH